MHAHTRRYFKYFLFSSCSLVIKQLKVKSLTHCSQSSTYTHTHSTVVEAPSYSQMSAVKSLLCCNRKLRNVPEYHTAGSFVLCVSAKSCSFMKSHLRLHLKATQYSRLSNPSC